MAKLRVWPMWPIPIESVSQNAQILKPKISYVDICKTAIVQKFGTILFVFTEKLRTSLPSYELSNWALETFKSQTWKIYIFKKIPTYRNFVHCIFFFLPKSSVCHGQVVCLSCSVDSNKIGISKCFNPKLENFVRWCLRKWYYTEISYAVFFYRKVAYVSEKLWDNSSAWFQSNLPLEMLKLVMQKLHTLIITKMPMYKNFVHSIFFWPKSSVSHSEVVSFTHWTDSNQIGH